MIFTYYPNKESKEPQYYCMWELPALIQSGTTEQTTIDYQAGKIKKEDLPIILPSATMRAGNKDQEHITNHSGLIWLDIDTTKNTNVNMQELQQHVNKDPYTYFTWYSARQGLRIAVYTNCNVNNHSEYWQDIVYHYQHKYNIIVDDKPKAINSFCFLVYNEADKIYCNPNSRRYDNINHKNFWQKSINTTYHYNNNIQGFDTFSASTSNEIKDRLNYRTVIDEALFTDKQKPIYINGGLDYAEIRLYKDLTITEGIRQSTIARYSMILLYLNPDVDFQRLLKHMQGINKKFCKPKLKSKEVFNICNANYKRYKAGKLNFNTVIQRKYVFYSQEFQGVELTEDQLSKLKLQVIDDNELKLKLLRQYKHRMSMQCLKQGKQQDYEQRIYNAIEALKTDKKVTYKQIAEYMGVSELLIKRRITDELREYCKI
ncbi:MAG: BT4734/BF3469 family protein [Bacteroidales bacterium]|jgi:hypothetical protein